MVLLACLMGRIINPLREFLPTIQNNRPTKFHTQFLERERGFGDCSHVLAYSYFLVSGFKHVLFSSLFGVTIPH